MKFLMLMLILFGVSFKLFCQETKSSDLLSRTTFSFINNFNAYDQKQLPNVKTFTFNEDATYMIDSSNKHLWCHLYIDYGYRFIKDSLFEKNSDIAVFEMVKEKTEIAANLKHSFSLALNTQLSPTFETFDNADNTSKTKLVTSSFLSPGTISVGSGFTKTFAKTIKVTANVLAYNIATFIDKKPYRNLETEELSSVKKDKLINFISGTELKLSLSKRYNLIAKDVKVKDLMWQLNSNFFYSPEKKSSTFRALNNLTLKIYKAFSIGFNTQVNYSNIYNDKKQKYISKLNYGYRIQLGVQL